MGLIISRFRKKQSTKEILEQIQKDVLAIEEYHVHTQQRQKRLVGSLVLYSFVLYLVAAVVFYFYYFPSRTEDQLLYATPFIVFPLVVYILKRLLTWYYRRKISKNEQKLVSLKERKAKILEEVMETETYKVAKEILETYAPERLHRSQMLKSPTVVTPAPQRLPTPSSTHPDVRRRVVAPISTPQSMSQPPRPMGSQNLPHQTPIFPVRAPLSSQSAPPRPGLAGMGPLRSTPAGPMSAPSGPGPKYSSTPAQSHHSALSRIGPGPTPGGPGMPGNEGPPGPPMPRPVLPRERGYLDRFVEYLVGDGPANRFALVCRQCESHNGMALKDEFPYLAFRCAYCFYWNPARKQRPFAPRLETITPQLPPPTPAADQDEDEDEDEEEEQEEQESTSEEEEEEEEEEGGIEDEESGSSSSSEDEEEEEGAVSSSELSSNKATSSQEGVCRPTQAGSLEDVAKSTPSSEPSSSDDHQNFVEVFFTSATSKTTLTTSTASSASGNGTQASSSSSSKATSMTETEETE